MSYTYICDIHDEIKDKAKEIWRIARAIQNSDDPEMMVDLANDIEGLANDIECDALDALSAGQSMEARLKEYRNAIENLGFRRI